MTLVPTRALALALGAASLVLVSPTPASAAVVDGSLHSGSTLVGDNGACTVVGEPGADDRVFTAATGRVSSTTSATYTGSDPATSTVAAGALSQSDTAARAFTRKGAFTKVVVDAHHLVQVTNDAAHDCGFSVVADSQAGATVTVKKRGKVRLDWSSNGPTVAEIVVTGPGGREVVRLHPSSRNGTKRINVAKGRYYVFVQFYTQVSESAAPVGGSKVRDIFYGLDAVYERS